MDWGSATQGPSGPDKVVVVATSRGARAAIGAGSGGPSSGDDSSGDDSSGDDSGGDDSGHDSGGASHPRSASEQLWCLSSQMAQSLGIHPSTWTDKLRSMHVPQLKAPWLLANGHVGSQQALLIPLSALPALGRSYKPISYRPLSNAVLLELERLSKLQPRASE